MIAQSSGSPNCGAAGTSNGLNFTDDSSCGFPAGETHAGVDPMLGALANNGGPTQTRLPQSGSPLIDAIPVASCQADGASAVTTDQRGVARPQGSDCDTGAVESGVTIATSCGPVALTPSAGRIANLTNVPLPAVPPPAGVTLPCGLIGFQITNLTPGQSSTVTAQLPIRASAYYKFQNGGWFQLTNASFAGNTATFTLKDGGTGDADGAANGTIVDPSGPSVAAIVVTPRFTG